MRTFTHFVAAGILGIAEDILWKTLRPQAVLGEEHAALFEEEGALILCYWHNKLTAAIHAHALASRLHRRKLNYLVSPSVDGDLVARLVVRRGGTVTRGSATRTGVSALRKLYRALTRGGESLVVAPDGPGGPIHRCKEGMALLAQLADVPILPVSCGVDRYWRAPTWDRAEIPKPFARYVIAFGEPLRVPQGTGNEVLSEASLVLAERLDLLEQQALDHLRDSGAP